MSDTKTKILDVAEKLVQQAGPNAMSDQQISDTAKAKLEGNVIE